MSLLLDTCALLWFLSNDSKLSALTSLKRKRRVFDNTYRSMPFACASGLLQATAPASFAFSIAVDPAM